jgi:phenylacetate-CoA ligase
MHKDRKEATRRTWLATLARYKRDPDTPGSNLYWAPSLDTASRDELTAVQNAKLAALIPFLYENSLFYRCRFEHLGMIPTDIQTVDDLPKWPVVDKAEMIADALAHPPYGTYATLDEDLWRSRGWMMFASSGTTGAPRVFRYSQIDREYWAWANARALQAMRIGKDDTVFMITGYGPHVWAWGVQVALAKMEVPAIPGGGMDARARANIIQRFEPTVICCTPSYALHLGRVLQDMGVDPGETAVRTLFIAGEPAIGITHTRARLEGLWRARIVEFYGCTEASPHVGGYSCPASVSADGTVTTHLMEDVQVWELVDADTREPVTQGKRGLTVCTCLNSESSPQLRFLVGDYTVFDDRVCACGRTHVRAVGALTGRADDLINLRGLKMYPSQIEEAVRAVPGIGDEYEIVLSCAPSGLDLMTIRIEHPDHAMPGAVVTRVAEEVRTRCEVRVDIEVLSPGTLPKTEFKAKRVRDMRDKIGEFQCRPLL